MRRGRMPAFWLAVGGVSILSMITFNLAADRLGGRLPGLRELNNYATRRTA